MFEIWCTGDELQVDCWWFNQACNCSNNNMLKICKNMLKYVKIC